MKKLSIFFLLILSVVMLVACSNDSLSSVASSSGSSNEKKETMRIGIANSENSVTYLAATEFGKKLSEYSGGTLEVELYPNASLGGELAVMQQVQGGMVESTLVASAVIGNIIPEASLFELPFLYKNSEKAHDSLDGEAGKYILDKLPENKLVGLGYWEYGFRQLTNSKHPVNTVDDLKGLKVRIQENPLHIAIWEALGASPTTMSFDQLFNSLEQKVIDGQENPIQSIYNSKFDEVQKYLSLTSHVYTPQLFIVNKEWYEGLSDKQKEALEKAAEEAKEIARELNASTAEGQLSELKELGMEVNEISEENLGEMKKLTQPVLEEYKAKYGEFYNLIDPSKN